MDGAAEADVHDLDCEAGPVEDGVDDGGKSLALGGDGRRDAAPVREYAVCTATPQS